MKEQRVSREVKVGIFVSVGILALLVSILLFGGSGLILTPTYHLKMELSEVQGLGSGSVVSLAGLKIGNISKIELNHKTNKMDVIMVINRSFEKRITKGAIASLKTQGALGDRYVYIEPHPLDGEPLKDGDYIQTLQTPDLFELISSKGAEFSNVLEVIKEVHRFVRNINANDRSAIMMENLAHASKNLNGFLIEGRQALKDIHSIVGDPATKASFVHLSNVMRKIDRGEGTLGALINDPSLHNRLMSVMGENPRNKYMKSLLRQSIQTNDTK